MYEDFASLENLRNLEVVSSIRDPILLVFLDNERMQLIAQDTREVHKMEKDVVKLNQLGTWYLVANKQDKPLPEER